MKLRRWSGVVDVNAVFIFFGLQDVIRKSLASGNPLLLNTPLMVFDSRIGKRLIHLETVPGRGHHIIVQAQADSIFSAFLRIFRPQLHPFWGKHIRISAADSSVPTVSIGIHQGIYPWVSVVVANTKTVSRGIREQLELPRKPVHVQIIPAPPVERHVTISFGRIDKTLL